MVESQISKEETRRIRKFEGLEEQLNSFYERAWDAFARGDIDVASELVDQGLDFYTRECHIKGHETAHYAMLKGLEQRIKEKQQAAP